MNICAPYTAFQLFSFCQFLNRSGECGINAQCRIGTAIRLEILLSFMNLHPYVFYHENCDQHVVVLQNEILMNISSNSITYFMVSDINVLLMES